MIAFILGVALIILGIIALLLVIPLKVTVCVGFLLIGVYMLIAGRDISVR